MLDPSTSSVDVVRKLVVASVVGSDDKRARTDMPSRNKANDRMNRNSSIKRLAIIFTEKLKSCSFCLSGSSFFATVATVKILGLPRKLTRFVRCSAMV